jgi:hypothetical protein
MCAADAKQRHRRCYAFMPVVWPKCASTAGNTVRNLKIIALPPSRMRRLSQIYGWYPQLIRELARAPALCWFTNSLLEELIY